MPDIICMPLCPIHDCPRPCPICEPEEFEKWYKEEVKQHERKT